MRVFLKLVGLDDSVVFDIILIAKGMSGQV